MFISNKDTQSGSATKIRNKNAAAKDLNSPKSYTTEDDHHTRLGEHAAVLWKFNKITDITVKLNGVKYPAHKTVLSCYSRYFREMLLKSDGKVSAINLQLESVSNDAFSCLLQYMYTGDLNLTCQNIGEVYTAARKLGMDSAIDTCGQVLKGKERREVHSVYVFVTARKLGMEEDAARAMKSMCKKFEQIVGTKEFLDLSHEQVVEYLSADRLATRSEVIVFLAALKWLSVQYLEREPYAVDVIRCVRFPMMNLNEVLACHSPPLLPGIVEIPAIKDRLLKATCFVASKTINEEKRFQKYDCPKRTYLLDREAIILWDPSIFDPDRHALYKEEVAASTIQASFRDYQSRKDHMQREHAAEVIQKAFRRHSQPKDHHQGSDRNQEEEEDSTTDYDQDSSSDDEVSIVEMVPGDKQKEERSGIVQNIRRSVASLFRRNSQTEEETEERILDSQSRRKENQEFSDQIESDSVKSETSDFSKRSPKWKTPYEETSILADLGEHEFDKSGTQHQEVSIEKIRDEKKEPENFKSDHDLKETKDEQLGKVDVQSTENAVSKLAKSDPKEEDSYGAIIISGGFNGGNADHPDSGKSLCVYEPATGSWSQLGEMHKPRHHHRIVYLKGSLYCIGGCNPERTKKKEKMVPLKSCFAFYLSSKKWNKIADMRHCRVYHATAVLNGMIYVVGGKDENDCMLNSVEVYDPDSNMWDELYDPLELPTIGAGVCGRDGKVWVVGGLTQDSSGKISVSKNVECYDPEIEEWCRDIPSLPSPLAFPSAVVCGCRVYVVGGCSSPTTADDMSSSDQVLYYDPMEYKWKSAPPMPTPRHFVGAVAVYKSLFVVGGLTTFKKEALDEVLLFNEENGTWVVSSRLPSPLCGLGAVSVPKENIIGMNVNNQPL